MCKSTNILQTLFLAGLILSNGVYAGQTSKYTGTVYSSPVKNLMPLGNGNGVLIMQSSGIVAMSGEPPTLHALSCSGMGLEKPDETTTTDFYCNLRENPEDSFDIKGTVGGEGAGSFDVIGGSGKWASATGKGEFVRVDESENSNKTVFHEDITVP